MSSPSCPLEDLRAALSSEYTLHDYLDAGGQGTVFRATFSGQAAALKVFRPDTDPRRLQRELALLRGIECPYLVTVLDTREIDLAGIQTTIVTYEYLSGGDLRQFLDPTTTPLSFHTLREIGCHITEAVEALWARRIVHRDIKPANIMKSSTGRFVLACFAPEGR